MRVFFINDGMRKAGGCWHAAAAVGRPLFRPKKIILDLLTQRQEKIDSGIYKRKQQLSDILKFSGVARNV